ncbi:methyl-accepting chemotaxis protein [Trichlorobacter ammonificans]|uniref:Methyl-accepting chemotaxis protein n=1 Tax=Trichlorobacter ammonificans TaxID=2916410 RepID=A0ABM9DCD5_9BACT|nr:methyl-accepting chemotaxis protein [Trichlorobacter ammonificans]CAH2032082.1 conserved protein of unknown function [Trichlorobacter ammonificans]
MFMRIKTSFKLGAAGVTLIMLVLIGVVLGADHYFSGSLRTVLHQDVATLELMHELYAASIRTEQAARRLLQEPDGRTTTTAAETARQGLEDLLNRLGKFDEPEMAALKKNLDGFWGASAAAMTQAVKYRQEGRGAEAAELLRTSVLPGLLQVQESAQKQLAREKTHLEKRTAATLKTVRTGMHVVGAFITLIALGFLVLFYVSSRMIVTPLDAMIAVADDLAHGDGDLTKRLNIQRADEIGDAANFIDSFIAKVQQSVITAKETAMETAVASQELSHIAANLSSTVQQQHVIVEESDALTQEVARNLDLTEEMAINTTETIEATRDMMQRFVDDLNAAAGVIIGEADNQRELATRMQQLATNAGTIREVLEIISDIADQTNLLALNASIEAARAGEMGRGFAVVADEVRQLAAKTQSSLSQINQSVTGVVAGVEKLYGESEESSRRMLGISESTRGLVSAADESGNRLAGAVTISSDLVKKSTFIATRTKQLMDQMEKMTRIADQNRAVAGEVEEVSASMAKKSENLRDTLGRFRC